MADKSQQTEKATPKRLTKAREDGQFPTAREFVSAMQFLAFVMLAASYLPGWLNAMKQGIVYCIRQAFRSELDAGAVMTIFYRLGSLVLLPLAAMGGILMAGTLVLNILATNFGVSLNNLGPKFKRINPVSKLSSLPSQNFGQLLQALVLIPVMFTVSYYLLRDQLPAILALAMQPLPLIAAFAGQLIAGTLRKCALALLVLGAVMLVRERSKYEKQLKMSKQEIKDESKENDGNPEVKAKIRRLQRDLRRKNMMKEVATATAVIVNPTHYAVAIKWESGMAAPLVVAKGKNYLAARIRARAVENLVPIIENPPLAQALYKSVEVGQEIPANLYRAVAEILAYIFRLTNPGNRRG